MLPTASFMHHTLPPATDKSPTSFPRPHKAKLNRPPGTHSTTESVHQAHTRQAVATIGHTHGEVVDGQGPESFGWGSAHS